MVLAGLARLSSVGEFAHNGVDHPSYLLGRFSFLWRLSVASCHMSSLMVKRLLDTILFKGLSGHSCFAALLDLNQINRLLNS